VLFAGYRNSIAAQRGAWDILGGVLYMKLWRLVCSVRIQLTFGARPPTVLIFYLTIIKFVLGIQIVSKQMYV
jgi:hypothetical protein